MQITNYNLEVIINVKKKPPTQHTHPHTHTYTHSQTLTLTNTHTHTHKHIVSHTHTHTHTKICARNSSCAYANTHTVHASPCVSHKHILTHKHAQNQRPCSCCLRNFKKIQMMDAASRCTAPQIEVHTLGLTLSWAPGGVEEKHCRWWWTHTDWPDTQTPCCRTPELRPLHYASGRDRPLTALLQPW